MWGIAELIVMIEAALISMPAAWTLHDQLDFYVAVGTAALALATVVLAIVSMANISLARRTVANDNIHRQEALAPILTMLMAQEAAATHPDSQIFSLAQGFLIYNDGAGPAIRPSIHFEGHLCGMPRTIDENLSRAIAPRSAAVYLPANTTKLVAPEQIITATLRLDYFDIFGNEYATVYDPNQRITYEWVKPQLVTRSNRDS